MSHKNHNLDTMNTKLLTKVLLVGLIAIPTMSQAKTWTDKETSLLNNQLAMMNGNKMGSFATVTTMNSDYKNKAIHITTQVAINTKYKDGVEESVKKSIAPVMPTFCKYLEPVLNGYSNVEKVEMEYIYTTSDYHKFNIKAECN